MSKERVKPFLRTPRGVLVFAAALGVALLTLTAPNPTCAACFQAGPATSDMISRIDLCRVDANTFSLDFTPTDAVGTGGSCGPTNVALIGWSNVATWSEHNQPDSRLHRIVVRPYTTLLPVSGRYRFSGYLAGAPVMVEDNFSFSPSQLSVNSCTRIY
ncbi:MAG TPA: hypothetical protein VF591_01550 [Pyrinomonadaceae bacterium]|jgi:hypothetical protein